MARSGDILVVEDDNSTRIILATLLEDEGYRVKSCPTAEEGLNHIISEGPIDIVITDLKLPDGSGLQVLWALKKINADAAIILITGHASVETAIKAVNEGAFAYHVKPLDIDALKSSVRNALRQQRLSVENQKLLQRLQRTNEKLESKNRELEEASLAKTQILSTVSHELKTPLTSIACYTDRVLLEREAVGPLNERQQRYLETVRENTYRLKALIGDLLDISRIESGSLELTPVMLDLRLEVEDAVRSMQAQINENQMCVLLNIPPAASRIKADRLRFSQIVYNLLSNACKYSPVGSTTTITAMEKAELVQIDVADMRIGVSAEDQSRLSAKFFRADNTATREVSGGI